jgi:23S rRNA (cytosine1962-C5)-methyltransferase
LILINWYTFYHMLNKLEIPQIHLLTSPDWKDYELLDSGAGQKLERYGPYRLIRPEPEAVWNPALPEKDWKTAHASFIPSPEENGGHWQLHAKVSERWQMQYRDLRFWASLSASRHIGLFPEQACQWDWIMDHVKQAHRPLTVLNLFGYTGLASLAAASAGARVTHLDASRKVVIWARDNQQISHIDENSIRWIIDDALKFVQREARRGSKYDGIILDPPKFGRGPKGEVWEFYKLLPNLLDSCAQLLSPNPQFLLMTAYAVKASALTLHYAVADIFKDQGKIQAGEVALQEKSANRLISMAIYARWSSSMQSERVNT